MPKIEWDDSLSVKNDEIDGQHKKWIEIHNELHEILLEGDNEAQDNAGVKTLKAMLDYANYHFNFEEEYMRKIDYPAIVEHRRRHKEFDNLIYSYYDRLQKGRIVFNTQLVSLMKNWLLDHIGIEDKKYSLFFERDNSK